MNLATKFQSVLQLTGHTRTSFAKRAGVTPAMLSRLIPQDGREPERKATLATLLRLISASEGLLTIQDFRAHRATRERPFVMETACPLCGRAIEGDAKHPKCRSAG
ncbi:3,4-dihydroxy-2-butanone 4-phosphate synthase [Rhodomicrobium vannielii ATCC 17100]|nr:3,4-dihydroxy-2-butanone 4-phosphate synthase [Rhodomicrobium vannielii ATCC 17100]